PGQGVHIIDNSEPTQPEMISFINIPGNYDLAVQDNIMYADSYIDLLAIDISNPQDIRVLHREENVFPRFNSFGFYQDAQKGVVTRWEELDVTETFEGNFSGSLWEPGIYQYFDHLDIAEHARESFVQQSNVPIQEFGQTEVIPVGRGGSMSRFVVNGDHLYTIDDENLQVFDLISPSTPTSVNEMSVSVMIETIYSHQSRLFIGAQNGMFIYDKSIPESPQLLSSYSHATACDPVVANDTLAYVTLRTGDACEGVENVLELVDIKDAHAPHEVARYQMQNPHGMGLDESTLFLCEGAGGIKVFNANFPFELEDNLIATIRGIHAYDVITGDNKLIVIGEDGVYQYDYSDLNQITLLSKITKLAL
ncbi:MAG: hypothetical protein AAF223_17605, partial [Bacteroidota bacterium]